MSTVMWKQYKKTAPFMQTGILCVSIIAYFATGRQILAALTFFAVMELGTVIGALWGYTMKFRQERASFKRQYGLPLERRR